MPNIYDNINKFLHEDLNGWLKDGQRADFCVGYFNLRGWKIVADAVENLSGSYIQEGSTKQFRTCRLLVGMQTLPLQLLKAHFAEEETVIDGQEALKIKRQLAQEFKEQLTIGSPSNDDEHTLRQLSRQLKNGKLTVRLHLRHTLHAKLYIVHRSDSRMPAVGLLGSSNLTLSGLSKQGELNVDVLDQDASKKLALWFDERWADKWSLDITKELIDIIDESWATERLIPPYYIYLKIAYHLSREARAGMNEFRLPNLFQKELLEFQQKAVQVAAHHLNARDGVMIGDVVGLGKTITAAALIKIFEEDFGMRALIISPRNLVEMWKGYIRKYELDKAHVISLGECISILPDLKRYHLVVIDESHNLRNDQGRRYQAIKSYIESNQSKVVLLSATPYNKTYLDLSNQLRLFIPDDKDLGISPERYIESLGGQVQFVAKHTETPIRSIKAFERSLIPDDWRELMRLYLVRRTRSFIKTHYAQLDNSNNRRYLTFADGKRSYFPDRIPRRVDYPFNPEDTTDQYARLYAPSVIESISSLSLPRYGLKGFLAETHSMQPTAEEEMLIANLSRAGQRLMGFCRTNLFKRLESSGHSFLLSISRHILRNYVFIYAIQQGLPLPIGQKVVENFDGYLEDEDIDGDGDASTLSLLLRSELYLQKAAQLYDVLRTEYADKFAWIRSDLFAPTLHESLQSDCSQLIEILNIGRDWDPNADRQLNGLYELLNVLHKDDKVLVFTQFSDTAYYLDEQLRKRGVSNMATATGKTEDPTHLAMRFSPRSNNYQTDQELRILIATDVLSEGQNLQDSHIIVNYDLPWAIIRLIQRAGRVDRIGQQAPIITCYSIWPERGIEEIINLRRRLSHRIEQNAEVLGGDEVFFEGDAVNLVNLYNEQSGILDEEEGEEEIDLASFAYQIWKNATDANPSLLKTIPSLPNVVYATKQQVAGAQQGVVVYTKTAEDNDVLAWLSHEGKLITQSQFTILKALQCGPQESALPRTEMHHDLVKQCVSLIKSDEIYVGGTLGKKTGTKYKTYTRLEHYCQKNPLFVGEDLKKAMDEIYKYPFHSFAKDTLERQMKIGISDSQLVELVVSLREDGKLCLVSDGQSTKKETQIICSMGMV